MLFILGAIGVVICIGLALTGYLFPMLIGGFIGSFFGLAGFGGAASGMIPGAIVGALIRMAFKPNPWDHHYVEQRLQAAAREEVHRVHLTEQQALEDQQRIYHEEQRQLQLRFVASLKKRARNWGFAAIIPWWIFGVIFLMLRGDDFAGAALISVLLIAPGGALVTYLVAAAIKLYGVPYPGKESGAVAWGFVVIVVLLVWKASNEAAPTAVATPALVSATKSATTPAVANHIQTKQNSHSTSVKPELQSKDLRSCLNLTSNAAIAKCAESSY